MNTSYRGKNKRVQFDEIALNKYKDDPNSCVEVIHCELPIVLHPFHLKSISQSIKDVLEAEVAKYNADLQGILLGFQNVRILSDSLPIFDDACYINLKVEADFYIFKPTVGSVLTGTVNKKSQDHVGCLVHQIFNVALPKPADEENWYGHRVEIGQEVQFVVIFLNLDARLPYIRGKIMGTSSEDSGFSTSEEGSTSKKGKITKFNSDDESESVVHKKKKKKSKKKEKLELEHELKEEFIDTINEMAQEVFSKGERKSKKRNSHEKKHIKTEPQEEMDYEAPEILQTSDIVKKKKSKKRKLSETNEELDCPEEILRKIKKIKQEPK